MIFEHDDCLEKVFKNSFEDLICLSETVRSLRKQFQFKEMKFGPRSLKWFSSSKRFLHKFVPKIYILVLVDISLAEYLYFFRSTFAKSIY